MGIREKLVEILQRTREEEEWFIAGLSDEERAAVGTLEAWAIKDTIAHLAEWRLRAGQRLAAARQGETPSTFDGDIDDLNAAVFEQYWDQSWDEVTGALERAHQEMVHRQTAQGLPVLPGPGKREHHAAFRLQHAR